MTGRASETSAGASVTAVAALEDDLRWRMYWFIRHAHRAVSRDDAAASVGISRKLAAFHLDKLVDAGLLAAGYEHPRGVRKVGRVPKVYRPTDVEVRVSIPGRCHDLLADILMRAVLAENDDEPAREAALRVAREQGRHRGEARRAADRPGRLGAERALTLAEQELATYGFEPQRQAATCMRLRNCPFHPMAARSPELVCGINHAFLSGYQEGLQACTVSAVLAPRPGECCVERTAAP
jgi:predicted ArsR family transcriptional regulator